MFLYTYNDYILAVYRVNVFKPRKKKIPHDEKEINETAEGKYAQSHYAYNKIYFSKI